MATLRKSTGIAVPRPANDPMWGDISAMDQENHNPTGWSKWVPILGKLGVLAAGSYAGGQLLGGLGNAGGGINASADAANGAASTSSGLMNGAITTAGEGGAGGAAGAIGASASPAALAGVEGGAGAAAGAGGGVTSTLAKIFGKNGYVDGTSLALGLMGAMSKQPDLFQAKTPYTGSASAQNSLESVLGLTHNAIDGLTSAPAQQLHGVVPEGPKPVTVPGIPFQIGGGMGVDPALRDPSLLTVDNSWLSKFKPPATPEAQPATTEPKPVVRRRPA